MKGGSLPHVVATEIHTEISIELGKYIPLVILERRGEGNIRMDLTWMWSEFISLGIGYTEGVGGAGDHGT